jgi:hypothetical protein
MIANRSRRLLAIGAAAATLIGGATHLQQYVVRFHAVPGIGPSFLLNAAASLIVAVLLIVSVNRLVISAGVAIAVGSIGALLMSKTVGIFNYIDHAYERPEIFALATEATAALLLVTLLLMGSRRSEGPETYELSSAGTGTP